MSSNSVDIYNGRRFLGHLTERNKGRRWEAFSAAGDALGVFTGTFTYSLIVLREVRAGGAADVPGFSVTVAVLALTPQEYEAVVTRLNDDPAMMARFEEMLAEEQEGGTGLPQT